MLSLILTALCFSYNFANRHVAELNLNLVNKDSLDKILQAKVFVSKDGQLQAAHLILGYKLISSSFKMLKCVIKARDPCLQRISVVVPDFLLPEGVPALEGTLSTQPILEGTLSTQPIPEGMPKVAFPLQHSTGEATSSQPIHKEEEEKEEKEKDIVDVSNSEDLYEVFDHPWTPETTIGDLGQLSLGTTSLLTEMGIQCRPRGSLLEMMES